MSRYEKVFTSANEKMIHISDKKTRIFNSDGMIHRTLAKKRKPTLEEEAEDKGWMLLK